MLRLFKNLKKEDVICVFICIALVIVQVWLDLKMPDYTEKLTEAVSYGNADMDLILKNGAWMLSCALGSMAASIICGFFAARVAASLARVLRIRLFDKVASFSDREVNIFSTPSLITRTTNDVVQIQMLVAMGLQMLIKAPITAIWAISKISNTSARWTGAVFVCVIFMVATVGTLVGLSYPKFKKIQRLTDDLNDTTRENLTGVRVVRAFNAEEYQEAKFEKVNAEITKTHLFTSRTMGIMMPVMTMSMSGLTLAIYWIGAYLINEADFSEKAVRMGEMAAFTQYALQVVMAFMLLVMIFVILPRTLVSARRINEVLDTEPSIVFNKEESGSANEKGSVEFKNVSFSYHAGDDKSAHEYCLKNLSFKIEPGETFAIIGATGSGKSTLVNLLPRFYDVTEGELLIDGRNIKEFSESEIESRISVAPQRAVLFAGSVRSNITYGRRPEEISNEKIERALDISRSDFVKNELKEGVEAPVAQGGSNFSGGQKQRLSIARAVFKDAEIYIFDDTFSALDYKTDMLVRRGIKENMKDKTVIIVAQRIGTIKNADKILVLYEGEIAGIGKHEELLKGCDIYKEIALSQLSEAELGA